jgi:predicted transcriptional regulator
MAIRPEFAERILAGEKKVEFRHARLSAEVSHVLLYATAPMKRLVGYFEVTGVHESSPADAWSRYEGVAGVDAKFFRSYFASRDRAVVIHVGRVCRLSEPVAFGALGGGRRPPRSFSYVDDATFRRVTGSQVREASAGSVVRW